MDKLINKEEQLRENKEAINRLKHECLDMQKIKKEKGDQLDRFTNNDVYGPKIKGYIIELKMWKDKYDRLLARHDQEIEIESKQRERMDRLEQEIEEMKDQIEEVKINNEPKRPAKAAK